MGAPVCVAATDDWLDPDGLRMPAGEVHGWGRGQNATVCGLSLHRSRLRTFGEVQWPDVQPESGGMADMVQAVCPRCAAGIEGRRSKRKPWTRDQPRP